MMPGMGMRPFAELTAGRKGIEVLRWLCVLPAAVLGHLAVDFLVAAAFTFVRDLGLAIDGESVVTNVLGQLLVYATPKSALGLLLIYVTPKAAFTVAGAKMAPRYQARTAMLLTLVGFMHSAWTHLYGNRIGPTNCLHVSAETVGLLSGAAFIFWQNRRDRSKRAGAVLGEDSAMPKD